MKILQFVISAPKTIRKKNRYFSPCQIMGREILVVGVILVGSHNQHSFSKILSATIAFARCNAR